MILSTKIFMMRDNWLYSIQFPSCCFFPFQAQSIRLHFDTKLVFLLSAVNHQMDLMRCNITWHSRKKCNGIQKDC